MLDARYRLDRRGLLQVGALGVIGSVLPWSNSRNAIFAHENSASKALELSEFSGRAKSVLIVLLSGGPSQLDMWDPKPDAPAEVRGEFSSISTTIPGVAV
jgi:hypothetical protein